MSARKSSTPVRSPKKQKPRTPRQPQPRRSWPKIIEHLNSLKSGKTRIAMGSDGSAQVTRVRLLKDYKNLTVSTEGDILVIEVA